MSELMIEPIRLSFAIRATPAHAFDTWTTRIGTWWPADHTVTGRSDLSIALEGWPGGRILERTADGDVHVWGEVQIWEPPTRLTYSWHLRRDASEATHVEIRFRDHGDGTTLVEIEHTGWERLGVDAEPWRDRNRGGWATLLPHYVTAVEGPV